MGQLAGIITRTEHACTIGYTGETPADVFFTNLYNVTGQPAMSVPLFWNDGGLPIGTHFVTRFGDEATLFRLAAQLEKARPWAARRPPVACTASLCR